jgi:NADH-quinone oxidoreductase subunit L
MLLDPISQGSGLFAYAPLIIFFPVIGLLLNLIFGRRWGERAVGIVASGSVGLSFAIAVLQFLALQAQPEGARVLIAPWINVGSLALPWSLKIDSLSVTMMLMVTGVSALIHIYAIGYMHEDVRFQGDTGRYPRFFIFFNLFVATMMVLVTGDSYLTMFVGWEGVGLCSYLLIGFWYEKGKDGIGNALAGKKAFVVNRIGDLGFLLAMFLVFWTFGSLQFDEVFQKAAALGPAVTGTATLITLFLLFGATGKSAQLPLFVWLPDAMAGPTPVSALIHAATMVTAGIYMIARNAVLFQLAPFSANLVAVVGALTALFSATIAVAQFDIKKVLAYSTISQLGFMVAAVGLGAYVAGMFHLVTHAFFKALLFLAAGSVIQGVEHGHHALESQGGHHHAGGEALDPQDMRNMGGLRSRMKVTFVVYVIGGLALAGIPPFAGFFSKDEILADASASNQLVYLLLAVAAFLTAVYIGRQLVMVFFGRPRSEAAAQAHENPLVMTIPLMALALLATLGGGLNLPGVETLTHWLEHTIEHIHAVPFSLMVAGISTIVGLIGLGIAWLLYGRRPLAAVDQVDPLRRTLGPLFTAMEHKWYVDELYDWLVVRRYVGLAHFLAETVDWRWWHDGFHDALIGRAFKGGSAWLAQGFDLGFIDAIANGLGSLAQRTAGVLRRLQNGYVRSYAASIAVGVVLLLAFILIR